MVFCPDFRVVRRKKKKKVLVGEFSRILFSSQYLTSRSAHRDKDTTTPTFSCRLVSMAPRRCFARPAPSPGRFSTTLHFQLLRALTLLTKAAIAVSEDRSTKWRQEVGGDYDTLKYIYICTYGRRCTRPCLFLLLFFFGASDAHGSL